MFRKILIANRGEIAVRIIRAAQALGVKTVAVYSEADRHSAHVRLADESYCIGAARSDRSYLDMDAILQTAEMAEVQAIHPGYGFLAENALFAARCAQHRITFIGPTPGAISLMGDKARAKHTMKEAGIPTIPGSDGLVMTIAEAKAVAQSIGFPVLLKATAGGGGRGMRMCHSEDELEVKFREAAMEAEKAFGNPGLYLERYITSGRHIEFQILADNFGNVLSLGERECSIQRKNQKLIEESPSPALTEKQRHEMNELLIRAISKIGYTNAGTIEFFQASTGELFFMEMNTRLQVEHPVTELVTGVDIVQWQLKIAANYRLDLLQENIALKGHAIECRINAEDPEQNFQPAPGVVRRFHIPTTTTREGETIRLDTHISEGAQIPPYYDSLIAKLIVHAQNREAAVALMRRTLQAAGIEGVPTTIGLHLRIMENEAFQQGTFDTHFIPTHFPQLVGAT